MRKADAFKIRGTFRANPFKKTERLLQRAQALAQRRGFRGDWACRRGDIAIRVPLRSIASPNVNSFKTLKQFKPFKSFPEVVNGLNVFERLERLERIVFRTAAPRRNLAAPAPRSRCA